MVLQSREELRLYSLISLFHGFEVLAHSHQGFPRFRRFLLLISSLKRDLRKLKQSCGFLRKKNAKTEIWVILKHLKKLYLLSVFYFSFSLHALKELLSFLLSRLILTFYFKFIFLSLLVTLKLTGSRF